MRWRDMRGSGNLEDRESSGPARGLGGGVQIGGVGLVVVVALSWLLGLNPLDVLSSIQEGSPPSAPTQTAPPPSGSPSAPGTRDESKDFVARVLGDTEDTWKAIFAKTGGEYRPPRLVLFRGAVESACGLASSAVGPFYCPPDRRVYLDRSFFEDLSKRFGAPGEFARAYVIAHEIGHHVQNLLGITDKVQSRGRDNRLSVMMELQADCLAGVWGHYAKQRNLLEPGDVEAGLAAAAAIGDDRLQRKTQGQVSPESFTHGSSAQRVRWFRTGLDTGDVNKCNTFESARP
ncbi:MAG TPA: neutral zinc metallopeptidase [Candidatus Limnocylindrales bacterium]|nr:neutral zinc metallopeptidase [Candidatus Limnocylindrales bacterium]